jgi:uncharacterized protein with FMN-binding domain
MRRSVIVLAATAAGLGFVLAYHPSGGGNAALPASIAASSKSGVGPGATAVGTDQPLQGGLGDLQVRVSAQNGKITSVGMAMLNVHGPQSAQITGSVIPQLNQQVLASNGRSIQAVSGATYTSQAYARSLQAALDKIAATGGSNAALGTGNGNGGVAVTGVGGHDD